MTLEEHSEYLVGRLQLQGQQVKIKGNEVEGKFSNCDIGRDALLLKHLLAHKAFVWQEVHQHLA